MNVILIFPFLTSGDVVYFDGLIETILAVGLVKPKAGMSSSLSKHVFVIMFRNSPPKTFVCSFVILLPQGFCNHTFTTSWF